jgi:REP element-mobilizing transposase RayT
MPLVIGYHLIWTGYGWWLPNDPRGSTSQFIRNDVLRDLGELHEGRKKIQPTSPLIGKFMRDSEAMLTYPRYSFDSNEIALIADAFAEIIDQRKYTCYACAIMPDHIHGLIRKHRDTAEEMIETLQEGSCAQLQVFSPPFNQHPVWGGPGWKVFLFEPDEIRRTIGYIEKNPEKAGMTPQHWPFVKPYDGWPLHLGHNPKSPWAREINARRHLK